MKKIKPLVINMTYNPKDWYKCYIERMKVKDERMDLIQGQVAGTQPKNTNNSKVGQV